MTKSDLASNDDSTVNQPTRESDTSFTRSKRRIDRRRLLEVSSAAIAAAFSGCSLLSQRGGDTTPTGNTDTETATETSTPTPYPEDGTPYEPADLTDAPRYNDDKEATPRANVQYGEKGTEGPLVGIYSDYAQVDTRDFWQEVGPELDAYVDEGRARVMEDFFPVVNEWSYAIPCALYEVKHQLDDDAYWTYQEAILEYYGAYSYDLLETIADEVGANAHRVRTAAEEGWRRPLLLTGKAAAEDKEIDYPPGVTVNLEPVEPTLDAVIEAIENAE